MINAFYELLARIGYTHPLHPTLTHAVIGLVMGAFIFAFVSRVRQYTSLFLTARHCIILALIALFPTVLLGYMDWQHYYSGGWLFEVKMKVILACVLAAFLAIAAIFESISKRGSMIVVTVYGMCLFTVIALGYFGGELVYGSIPKEALCAEPGVEAGSALFTSHCSACHRDGGNIYKAHLALRNAPQLIDFDTFLAYIRSPQARDGSKTIMPPFLAEKLSDQQAKEIYLYIVQVLKNG